MSPKARGETEKQMNERKSPCVLQDIVPFGAAAQKVRKKLTRKFCLGSRRRLEEINGAFSDKKRAIAIKYLPLLSQRENKMAIASIVLLLFLL